MQQDHQPRPRGQGPAKVIRIDESLLGERQLGQPDAAVAFQLSQGAGDRIVFQQAGDHVVSRAKHSLDSHVEGVGAVEGENHPAMVVQSKKAGQQVAGVVQGFFHPDCPLVSPSAGIGPIAAQVVLQFPVDGLRFGKAGGCVVQIDHGGWRLPAISRFCPGGGAVAASWGRSLAPQLGSQFPMYRE